MKTPTSPHSGILCESDSVRLEIVSHSPLVHIPTKSHVKSFDLVFWFAKCHIIAHVKNSYKMAPK